MYGNSRNILVFTALTITFYLVLAQSKSFKKLSLLNNSRSNERSSNFHDGNNKNMHMKIIRDQTKRRNNIWKDKNYVRKMWQHQICRGLCN